MAYCTNCGKKIEGEMKFCPECGTSVEAGKPSSDSRQEYTGTMIICPNCGDSIGSLMSQCPSCGFELRGIKASETVREFSEKLLYTRSEEEKVTLLRSYPIPNTIEDIFEFMILAVSNMTSAKPGKVGNRLSKTEEAWRVKFEQGYQKACLLFKSEPEFSKIQKIYEEGHKKIDVVEKSVMKDERVGFLMRNILVWIGVGFVIAALVIDLAGDNSALAELVGEIILIVSASKLTKREAPLIDYGLAAISGIITLGVSFFMMNGVMGQLCGTIILIVTAVKYGKAAGKKKD